LYKRDPICEINIRARTNNLRSISKIVILVHNGKFTRPFTQREMEEVVKDLPRRKAIGFDGISTEVYKNLWPNIGQAVQKKLKEMLEQKQLHPWINAGYNSLSQVKEDPKLKSQTTGQIQYYAKTMANRMQSKFLLWIKTSQTGFVKDRYILDNVFVAYELIKYARKKKQELIILMIDFKKAYDQVN
jgi:hypothetical protein